MKKIVSLGMLCVLLYITAGYYFHYLFQKNSQNQEFYSSVSATLPFEGTIDFMIPVPFYGTVDKAYEAKQGEFFYKNQYYNILGSKIENNTIVVTCVANPKAKKLNDALLSFVDHFILSDDGSTSNSKTSKITIKFLPELASFTANHKVYLYEWLCAKVEPAYLFKKNQNFLGNQSPPPEVA